MPQSTETVSPTAYRRTIEDCIQYARRNGVGDFHLSKRSSPRLPYVHPVRYCLGDAPSQNQSHPGYTLNIGLGGMSISCREAIIVGSSIRISLPLSDGSTAWMQGTIAYCEPDAKHYRAGIAFLPHDDNNADYNSEAT